MPEAKTDSGGKSLPSSARQEENLKGGSHETEFTDWLARQYVYLARKGLF